MRPVLYAILAFIALSLAAGAIALLLAGRDDVGQLSPHDGWVDDSPHKQGFITSGGVRLEYLEWGRSQHVGQTPIVFLAGLGLTAHIFDQIAPEFTDDFRVIALTRRSVGDFRQTQEFLRPADVG